MGAGTIEADPDSVAGDAPALPPIQGGTPTAPPPLQQASSQAAPPAAPPLAPAAPQGGIAQGTGNNKGEVPTPDVKPEYDPKKLAKANTTLDLLNAMKPKSRNEYMDWWEKQHGEIDQKYDALKAQIGARPSDDEPQTRKEKFAALLEFGLHLMKASGPNNQNQGAPIAEGIEGMQQQKQADIQGKQKAYDAQAQAIESARAEEQKGIGTPAAAMKAQLEEDKADTSELKDKATAFKDVTDATSTRASMLGAPTYAEGPDHTIHAIVRDADGRAHAEPVTGIDGKPFQGRILGREAGSGINKTDQDPAAVRTHKYLVNVLGIDPDTAAKIIFKPKTGNPDADHAAIYKSALQVTFGDDEKAKRIADQYVLDQYGAAALATQHAPLVQPPKGGRPPAAALQGLQKGMVRDFGPKGKWTLGVDGQPVQVGAGIATAR